MAPDDDRVAHAPGMRRLDELAALQAHGLTAHDARHVEPGYRADGDIDQHDVAPKDHRQHDDEEDEGHRIENIDDAHHHAIDLPADESRAGAPAAADDDTNECRHGP